MAIPMPPRILFTCIALLIAAVLGSTAPGDGNVADATLDSHDGRIVARRLADGRIELGFQPEGGGRVLPTFRHFPADAAPSLWKRSSAVSVGRDRLGWIVARRLTDGRVEFGFRPEDGDRILPSSRVFPATARVNRWLRSSIITLAPPAPLTPWLPNLHETSEAWGRFLLSGPIPVCTFGGVLGTETEAAVNDWNTSVGNDIGGHYLFDYRGDCEFDEVDSVHQVPEGIVAVRLVPQLRAAGLHHFGATR